MAPIITDFRIRLGAFDFTRGVRFLGLEQHRPRTVGNQAYSSDVAIKKYLQIVRESSKRRRRSAPQCTNPGEDVQTHHRSEAAVVAPRNPGSSRPLTHR